MGVSRGAASSLLGVLHDIRDKGVNQTLGSLKLDQLIGRPTRDILIALTDVVCRPGGPIDEAVARNAYIDTVMEVVTVGVDLDRLTNEQIEVILISFISRSIEARVIEDIGQKLDTGALTPAEADMLTGNLHDFIQGAVRDRLGLEIERTHAIDKPALGATIEKIYEVAFSLIEAEATALI